VIKADQILGQDEQDFLRQVVDIGLGRFVLKQPASNQRGVNGRQASPRGLIAWLSTQPIEKTERCLVHAVSILSRSNDRAMSTDYR
jgi:hypothetical protein